MRQIFSLSIFIIVACACVVVPGQARAGSGFYLSSEIGANFASGLETTGTSNDRASVCDEFINPQYHEVETTPGLEKKYNCTGENRGAGDFWKNKFDGGTGILAGAAVGWSFSEQYPDHPLGGFRVELEYLYRGSKYDQTPRIVTDQAGGDGRPKAPGNESDQKLDGEIYRATDRIGSITSHNLFANLFYDFMNTSRFTPYVGVGAGFGFTDVEYVSLWERHYNSKDIETGKDHPNYEEIRKNLAKTVSVAQITLNDALFGFQVLFGVDYAFTEATSLGLKGRWVTFESFKGDGVVWDPLRSHVPNLRMDGSEPVSGAIEIDDVEFFGVSLNLKYHF